MSYSRIDKKLDELQRIHQHTVEALFDSIIKIAEKYESTKGEIKFIKSTDFKWAIRNYRQQVIDSVRQRHT